MGKVQITVQGSDADMQRMYDHLVYHVKQIEPMFTESYNENHKKERTFWVVI